MLAATIRCFPDDVPPLPLIATPKVDGIRAMMVMGSLVSRSMKAIPNKKIKMILELVLPDGADGEITCGDLWSTTSILMSENSTGNFTFHWFDWAYDTNAPYTDRVYQIKHYVRLNHMHMPFVKPLDLQEITSIEQLCSYEQKVLLMGYEGVILRRADGRYKYGRSTLKEALMVKLKRTEDFESTIIGFEEMVHKDKKRSNKLGSIKAINCKGAIFRIGTGYTDIQRQELWNMRNSILMSTVKYRCYGICKNGKPRCPVFVCIRHEDDM